MTAHRTTTEILADLTVYRAARTALVAGERVEDVWRDGRRIRMSTITMGEVQSAIKELEREYAAAEAAEAGRPRRRAIGHYF